MGYYSEPLGVGGGGVSGREEQRAAQPVTQLERSWL